MSFFITEKGIEERLARQTRRLPMPEGGEQDFSGFALMWKALDFLVVCGAWDRAELVAIAQERLADPSIDIRERLPQRHGADRRGAVRSSARGPPRPMNFSSRSVQLIVA